MSQGPGWYRDPFHRGQERYWDGKVWTQGTRPAAAGAGDGAGAPVEDAAPVEGIGADPSEPPAPAAPTAPSFAPLGAPVDPAVAVGAVAPAAGHAAWAPPTIGTATDGTPARGPRHGKSNRGARNVMYGVAAAALLLVAGGVSTAVLLGGSGDASAQEAVAQAASQTDAQSADMSLSMDMSISGLHESVTANGAFDFARKLGSMTMTIPVNGKQYSEQEIEDGSTVYVNIGGLSNGLASGKPWVSESTSGMDVSGNGLGTLDPTTMLQQLQSSGGTVSSLGQTTYDGTAVTEYAASLPSSALMGDIGKLPASLQQGVSGLHFPDMHMNIYVTQDNLLKAVTLPSYSVSFAGQTLSMDMTMVLSNYGTTVNVTPPPADQVQPLSQLGGGSGLGNSGSTGDTGSTGNTGNSGTSV